MRTNTNNDRTVQITDTHESIICDICGEISKSAPQVTPETSIEGVPKNHVPDTKGWYSFSGEGGHKKLDVGPNCVEKVHSWILKQKHEH